MASRDAPSAQKHPALERGLPHIATLEGVSVCPAACLVPAWGHVLTIGLESGRRSLSSAPRLGMHKWECSHPLVEHLLCVRPDAREATVNKVTVVHDLSVGETYAGQVINAGSPRGSLGD